MDLLLLKMALEGRVVEADRGETRFSGSTSEVLLGLLLFFATFYLLIKNHDQLLLL